MQRRPRARRFVGRLLVGVATGYLLSLGAVSGWNALRHLPGSSSPPQVSSGESTAALSSKKDLRQILDVRLFSNLTQKGFELPVGEEVLHVETTLDVDLQNYLLKRLDRQNSRYIGIVVMDAATGRVLSLAGYDRTDPLGNPCLESDYPAASIFKMVTAASAVDQCGYTAESPMQFNGGKHTLYKRQLEDVTNRYTTTVSLAEAFAESVNPVFGKIGEQQLGKPLLEKSAEAFGFNTPLDFELNLSPSHFEASDRPYHWAELGSGFNRETTLSPLHGAVMASAVLNGGRMVAPSIVDRVLDDKGEIVYHWQPGWGQQAMSAKASAALTEMMEDTVTSGTARKTFRDYRKDSILSRLQIGGKTGSINGEDPDVRFDWFIGFARERQGDRQVIIAAMVAHQDYIGTRASQYARMVMTHYFRDRPGQDL